MKQYIYKIALLLLLTTSISCNKKETPSNFIEDLKDQKIAKIIQDNLNGFPNKTQIAIALIDNDKTEYIGIVNNNNHFQTIENKNNLFEIGSITKVFTGILLADLVQKGHASLDEELKDIYSFQLKEGEDIQLVQLANHTSGLPRRPSNFNTLPNYNPNDPLATYNIEALEDYLKTKITLENPIGTIEEYSNIGFTILCDVLIKKTGRTYENLLQETILKPLSMHNSSTLIDNIDKSLLVSPGLNPNGDTTLNWNFTNITAGIGGIKSSLIDLEKFVYQNFKNAPLYNLPQTLTNVSGENEEGKIGFGLGWNIVETNQIKLLKHDGGTFGYVSELQIDKKSKKGVIVLSNVSLNNPNKGQISTICTSLLEYIYKN